MNTLCGRVRDPNSAKNQHAPAKRRWWVCCPLAKQFSPLKSTHRRRTVTGAAVTRHRWRRNCLVTWNFVSAASHVQFVFGCHAYFEENKAIKTSKRFRFVRLTITLNVNRWTSRKEKKRITKQNIHLRMFLAVPNINNILAKDRCFYSVTSVLAFYRILRLSHAKWNKINDHSI